MLPHTRNSCEGGSFSDSRTSTLAPITTRSYVIQFWQFIYLNIILFHTEIEFNLNKSLWLNLYRQIYLRLISKGWAWNSLNFGISGIITKRRNIQICWRLLNLYRYSFFFNLTYLWHHPTSITNVSIRKYCNVVIGLRHRVILALSSLSLLCCSLIAWWSSGEPPWSISVRDDLLGPLINSFMLGLLVELRL